MLELKLNINDKNKRIKIKKGKRKRKISKDQKKRDVRKCDFLTIKYRAIEPRNHKMKLMLALVISLLSDSLKV